MHISNRIVIMEDYDCKMIELDASALSEMTIKADGERVDDL